MSSCLASRVLSCLTREKIYYYGSCTRSGWCGWVTWPLWQSHCAICGSRPSQEFLHATFDCSVRLRSHLLLHVPASTVCLITCLDTLGQRGYRSMRDLDRNHGCPISRSTIQFPVPKVREFAGVHGTMFNILAVVYFKYNWLNINFLLPRTGRFTVCNTRIFVNYLMKNKLTLALSRQARHLAILLTRCVVIYDSFTPTSSTNRNRKRKKRKSCVTPGGSAATASIQACLDVVSANSSLLSPILPPILRYQDPLFNSVLFSP